MKTRTVVFVLAGLAFAGHVMAGKDNSSSAASASPSAGDANVDVNVSNITRGSAGVSIRNVSGRRLSSVFLHCTFRDQYGARIDNVPVHVSDLAPSDTANEVARMPNDVKASSVDCRVEHAYAA